MCTPDLSGLKNLLSHKFAFRVTAWKPGMDDLVGHLCKNSQTKTLPKKRKGLDFICQVRLV